MNLPTREQIERDLDHALRDDEAPDDAYPPALVLRWLAVFVVGVLVLLIAVPRAMGQATQPVPPLYEVWSPDKVITLIGAIAAAVVAVMASIKSTRAESKADSAKETALEAQAVGTRNVNRIIDVAKSVPAPPSQTPPGEQARQ